MQTHIMYNYALDTPLTSDFPKIEELARARKWRLIPRTKIGHFNRSNCASIGRYLTESTDVVGLCIHVDRTAIADQAYQLLSGLSRLPIFLYIAANDFGLAQQRVCEKQLRALLEFSLHHGFAIHFAGDGLRNREAFLLHFVQKFNRCLTEVPCNVAFDYIGISTVDEELAKLAAKGHIQLFYDFVKNICEQARICRVAGTENVFVSTAHSERSFWNNTSFSADEVFWEQLGLKGRKGLVKCLRKLMFSEAQINQLCCSLPFHKVTERTSLLKP